MAAGLHVQALGGLTIWLDGTPLTGFHSRKVEALVVYLISTRAPQPRDILADLLWDEQTQASANLRVLLTDLRQFLAPYFLITRNTIALNPASESLLDAAAFEAHLDAAYKQRERDGALTRNAVSELEKAFALYHGDFLKGFYIRSGPRFEQWVLLEQERLRRHAVNALQLLTNFYLERREYAQGIETARRLFEIDPLNELTQQQLMQLLARRGEHNAALAQYDKYKQLLAVELNAEPAPETTALRDQIRAGTFAEKINVGVRSNLPRSMTPFLGRTQELAELEEKLKDTRVPLITLLGPGGVGKTRLALRAAENVYAHFQDGVTFVALASVGDSKLVASTISETLNLEEQTGESISERLKNFLRGKELLLLLDNFEQVVDAAPLLTELLTACPRLKILVTSREKLHLYGEQEFPVAPLPFPDVTQLPPQITDLVTQIARYPAVALFVQRATAAQPDFKLTAGNARAIAEICARLDGLPLAIELAAARINLLPPPLLRERLVSRLDLLTAGERDRAPRHQTMRGALDWSYALLNSSEQKMFRQLAVFVGGWDLSAAAKMAEPQAHLSPLTLNLLKSLADKSLIQRVAREPEDSRFTMLETIREYARERLEQQNQTASLERQHAFYFLELAGEAETYLRGPSQVQWLDRIETELDNVRAALQWALRNQEADIGLKLAHRLGRFWTIHDHWAEGRRWLEQLLALPQANGLTISRAQGLYSVGWLTIWMSDFATARAYLEQALALAQTLEEEYLVAQILTAQSSVYQSQGDSQTATVLVEQARALFETHGDANDLAWCDLSYSGILLQQGAFEAARPGFERGLAEFQRVGDHWGSGIAYSYLAMLARFAGDLPRASTLKAHALDLLGQVGDHARIGIVHFFLGSPSNEPEEHDAELAHFEVQVRSRTQQNDRAGIADAMLGLASAYHRRGEQVQAETCYKRGLVLNLELGRDRAAAECIEGLAGIAAAMNRPARAARLFGAVDASLRFVVGPVAHAWRANYGADLAAARSQLEEGAFNQLWAEGRALTLEQAAAYALTSDA